MSKPEVCLICALAANGVIGRDNQLPWRLREDLRNFRALTRGHAVIMGRKTWESLGKPLPERRNIVVSRQTGYAAEGAQVVASLREALALCVDQPRVFVIGGAQIYALALPLADRLYLTEVAAEVEGDARFPDFSRREFVERQRAHYDADEHNQFAFDVVEYSRDAPGISPR